MHELAIIIDDDPISILVCETMLKKTEFAREVKSFKQAEEGLQYLDTHFKNGGSLPDFIFLDVVMPLMDGWQFLDAYSTLDSLPENRPHVLMLSAAFDPEDRARSAESPMVIDFISKPITKEILIGFLTQKS